MVSSVAACCVRPTAHAVLCIVNGNDSVVFRYFCPWWPWPLTLTFDLGRDFCTLHPIAKFHRPTFSHSEVTVRTNTLTNWQTNRRGWKHTPRFATLRRWVIRKKLKPTRMWANANVMAALPNIGGALCSTPQSLADAHYYTVSQKKGATLTIAITLSFLDGFAKFFHCCKEQ